MYVANSSATFAFRMDPLLGFIRPAWGLVNDGLVNVNTILMKRVITMFGLFLAFVVWQGCGVGQGEPEQKDSGLRALLIDAKLDGWPPKSVKLLMRLQCIHYIRALLLVSVN
jgi:hypothetical protein